MPHVTGLGSGLFSQDNVASHHALNRMPTKAEYGFSDTCPYPPGRNGLVQRTQHINLAQLGNDLFRLASFPFLVLLKSNAIL